MNPKVVIYTAEGCSFCIKQKEWLDNHSIEYKEKKVEFEKNRQELLEKKVLGVPYTVIKIEDEPNEITVAGFKLNKLECLLLED
ncbi:glutaredoxin domain-containing protein [Bacillus safensis subsp. osmophilus]